MTTTSASTKHGLASTEHILLSVNIRRYNKRSQRPDDCRANAPRSFRISLADVVADVVEVSFRAL